MSAIPPNIRERLDELLVAQTFGDITSAERAELDALLANPDVAKLAAETDAAAAAMLLAFKDAAPARMPADAKARLLSKGQAMVAPRSVGTTPSRGDSSGRAVIGWLIAASLAVVAAIGWLRPTPPPQTVIVEKPAVVPPEPTLEARLAKLLAEPGTKTVQMAGQDKPRSQGASAEAIWNNDKQEGYLKISKLGPNDPKVDQYQLWIFDKARATYPVDGGVFDISQAQVSASGDIIIPMHPALKVTDPAAFAVTIEQPGGVVVTDKTGLVLLGAAK